MRRIQAIAGHVLQSLIVAVAIVGSVRGSAASAAPARFGYRLERPARTSAGVFTRAGALVRTLWSGVAVGPGRHLGEWDGTDDAGARAPRGRYQVRVVASGATYTWEGVVGNTSD